jgi:hypothetical protein
MFENGVLRRIFGPKKDEVIGEWRKLHNEELHDLYSSPTIVRVIKSRRLRWAGIYRSWGRREACIGFWWGNLREGPWRRWEDNIKMDVQEVGFGGMDWIGLARDRDRWRAIVNAVMHLRV